MTDGKPKTAAAWWRGALPSGLPAAGHDLTAALALAAIAIPEQIATARLAGMPPATGLAVFAAGSLAFFLLGSNRYLSVGADSTIAPILAAALVLLGLPGTSYYTALAATLALMVGAIVMASGVLRMGWIARLLSVPVITGFLAGIAIHIAVSQMPALLGIETSRHDLAGIVLGLAHNIPHLNPVTLGIGLGVFAVIFICDRIDIRLPGALAAMIVATLCVRLSGLASHGVTVLGAVQQAAFGQPHFTMVAVEKLLPIALIVSLVVIIQTAAVSRAFQADADAVDLNRDLIGVGLGNILSGLAGGFAANSSPPRTAIVCESGSTSRFAGLCAALILAGFLLFGLRLLDDVPAAALAGLLLFVAQRIFRIDTMTEIAGQSRAEFALLVATAVAIVFTPIETGVGIGIALSLMYGVWTIAQTRAVELKRVPNSTIWWPPGPNFAGERQEGIVVVGFQAPLFFLNVETFRKTLNEIVTNAPQPVRAVVLEASNIVELDFSGAQTLISMIKYWKARDVDFWLARLESLRAERAFEKFGILALIGGQHPFHSVEEAVIAIRS